MNWFGLYLPSGEGHWEIFAKAWLERAGKESVKITGGCRAKTGLPICPFSDAFLRGIRSFYTPNPEQPLPAERSSLSPRGLTQGAPHGFGAALRQPVALGSAASLPGTPSQPGHRTRSPASCSAPGPRLGAAPRAASGPAPAPGAAGAPQGTLVSVPSEDGSSPPKAPTCRAQQWAQGLLRTVTKCFKKSARLK